MSDDPRDNLPLFNRVTLRAVLVGPGDDPARALIEAGIFDPLPVPVAVGNEPSLPDGLLGDGITPNLVAVLETQRGAVRASAPGPDRSHPVVYPPSGAVPTRPPATTGQQPLAPIGRSPA